MGGLRGVARGLLAALVPFLVAIPVLGLIGPVREAGPAVLASLAAAATAAADGGQVHGLVHQPRDLDGFVLAPGGSGQIATLAVTLAPLSLTALGLLLLALPLHRRPSLPAAACAVAAYAGGVAVLARLASHTYGDIGGSSFGLRVGVLRPALVAAVSGALVSGAVLLLARRPPPQRLRAPLAVLGPAGTGLAAVLGGAAAASLVVGLVAANRAAPTAATTSAAVVLGLPNVVGYALVLGVGGSVGGAGRHVGVTQITDPPTTPDAVPHGALTIGSLASDQPLWWGVPVLLALLLVAGAVLVRARAARPVASLVGYAVLVTATVVVACLLLRVSSVVEVADEPGQSPRATTSITPQLLGAVLRALAWAAVAAVAGGLLGGRPLVARGGRVSSRRAAAPGR